MRSNAARAVGVALIAVAVALFFVLRDEGDSGSEPATEPTTATSTTAAEPAAETIELRNGKPVGGVRELEYAKGDRVRIEVLLDEPQEDVHIHGYEIERLDPRDRAEFDFVANLDGIYELEAHGPSGDVVLAEIRVNPS